MKLSNINYKLIKLALVHSECWQLHRNPSQLQISFRARRACTRRHRLHQRLHLNIIKLLRKLEPNSVSSEARKQYTHLNPSRNPKFSYLIQNKIALTRQAINTIWRRVDLLPGLHDPAKQGPGSEQSQGSGIGLSSADALGRPPTSRPHSHF